MDEIISFVNANGIETYFDVRSGFIIYQRGNMNMPPLEHIRAEVPELSGSRLLGIKTNTREISLGIYIMGNTTEDYRDKKRLLESRLDPNLGDGYLLVRYPNGGDRKIACRYADGLGIGESVDENGPNWTKAALLFLCHDPYFYNITPTTADYTSTPSSRTFFPIFPLRLVSSSIFGRYTINNPGDVEAWPIWTITGPGSNITLRNDTTGERIAFSDGFSLSDGESVVIDTRRFIKSVTVGSENVFDQINFPSSTLWALAPGDNDVWLEMGATGVDSLLHLTYYPTYNGI